MYVFSIQINNLKKTFMGDRKKVLLNNLYGAGINLLPILVFKFVRRFLFLMYTKFVIKSIPQLALSVFLRIFFFG